MSDQRLFITGSSEAMFMRAVEDAADGEWVRIPNDIDPTTWNYEPTKEQPETEETK